MTAHPLARLAPHPPKPPAPSASKAGRNLKAALPVAIGLLGLVAFSVAWRIEVFVVLVACALCLGLWEIAGAFLNRGVRISLVPLCAGVIAMVWATWVGGLAAGFTAFVVAAIVSCAWRCLRPGGSWASHATAGVFALAWIGLVGCFAVALAAMDRAAWMVALLILMPAASDTGGWAFGVLWGKHPMSPSISPKKSWEGLAGSFVLATVVALLLVSLVLSRPWYAALIVSAAAVLCATVGDLSESLLKRDLGVKDMGSIFPGHGGMLDRIDSILMWAPVCYVIMSLPVTGGAS
ncbi:MAG: phosphatidate cytidylyltransferase [Actinomycetaceae bacterium]|nr:phosphatidate cytidylyltransferase [Actinomycetaceae bacterium]